ncbi:DUF58 domain-containing protein [Chloroflexus sp.]|uniref:DUF58 domain-containing protein n=1 Tax=Chloroflexus sp. TaxID=1904827 RepID=UPI00404A2C9E
MTPLRIVTGIAVIWLIFDPQPVVGFVAYTLLGLQVLGWFWPRIARNQITWQRCAPLALAPDETAEVEIQITYRGWLPLPYPVVREDIPVMLSHVPRREWVLSLWPGQRYTLRYPIQCRRRGLYWLGPLSLRIGSVFEQNETQLTEQQPTPITVTPAVVSLRLLNLIAALPCSQERYHLSLFEDTAQKIGVRSYQVGDPPRRIDWKTSARLGDLQVRELTPTIARETLIVLAFAGAEYPGRFAYDNRERAVVATASLASTLIQRRQAVGLCSNGYDPLHRKAGITLLPATGVDHLRELLVRLGRIEPAIEAPLIEEVITGEPVLRSGATLVLITGALSTQVLTTLLTIRQRAMKVVLVLTDPGLTDLLHTQQYGIVTLQIDRTGAIIPCA